MPSLSDSETEGIYQALSACDVYSLAVAKLYKASPDPNSWTYTGVVGAAVIVTENGINFLRILDIKTKHVTFEQEIYDYFQYTKARPYFHTFEMKDFVAGLCFADEEEANLFYKNVQEGIEFQNSQLPQEAAPAEPAYEEPAYDEPAYEEPYEEEQHYTPPPKMPPKPAGGPPPPLSAPPPSIRSTVSGGSVAVAVVAFHPHLSAPNHHLQQKELYLDQRVFI